MDDMFDEAENPAGTQGVSVDDLLNAVSGHLGSATSASSAAADLQETLAKVLRAGRLTAVEAAAVMYEVALNAGANGLAGAVRTAASLSAEEEAELRGAAGMMAMMNVYYRFRHAMKECGDDAVQPYKVAGLKARFPAARAIMGHRTFELAFLAVSAANGCAGCMVGHEADLRGLGVETEAIHDVVRLAAVIRGIGVVAP